MMKFLKFNRITLQFVAITVLVSILALGAILPLALAAPAAAPIDAPLGARVYNVNTAAITQNTVFAGYLWGVGYTESDLFYQIDQTTGNTLTVALSVSPNGVTYFAHAISPTMVYSNTADANGYVYDIPVHGVYWKLTATVENTETVTPVLRMVVR